MAKPNGYTSIDKLLTKRIHQVIAQLNSEKAVLTVDRVGEELVSEHVEYKRKPKRVLERIIHNALVSKSSLQKTVMSDEKDKHSNKRTGREIKNAIRVKKRKLPTRAPETPKVRYSDLGGIDDIIKMVREVCEYPLLHRNLYEHLGVIAPCGVLLHGPPGCGKTMLAHAIAGELQVQFYNISAPEIVSGMSGESEEKIRNLFEEAKRNSPSIIFLDEIDAITGKRDSSARGMERRIVAQLLTCMDSLSLPRHSKENKEWPNHTSEEKHYVNSDKLPLNAGVIVIGATNRPDSLDPALRRAGRFDREIALGIPDLESRIKILHTISRKMKLSGEFNYKEVAKRTPGFVGADLAALCKEAAVIAVNRVFENRHVESNLNCISRIPLTISELESVYIAFDDFLQAIIKVQPSSKREGFVTVPKVSWEDIGALSSVQKELKLSISEPISNPEKFRRMGLNIPAGILLYGPPGCGKTLLAKAVANSSGANFISVKGPELLNKYVGESERAVRQVFSRARASAPCIVFFDELDSLCPKRAVATEGSGVSERVVNQLLTEMDGLDERRNVFVIAATNRPDIIDPAMLRPGRLSKLLYVALPTKEERVLILKTCVRKTPINKNVRLTEIAQDKRMEGFSGADIASVVREAAMTAIEYSFDEVLPEHFEKALDKVKPSVSDADRYAYLFQHIM